jgi:hypothetical protein
MRAILAVVLTIVILFAGVYALSFQSQSVEDAAVANGTNETAEAYNLTNDVYEGLTEVGSGAVVWMGAGVVVLLGLGFLVVGGRSGR